MTRMSGGNGHDFEGSNRDECFAANVAERVLLALAGEQGPVFPKTLQRDLELSRSSVSRGLYALLIIGFAERGSRHRQGVLWSLTPAGRRAING